MAASTPGKCVLLVDDDRALVRLVEMWLTEGGYDVVACDSFGDAKHQLTVSPPDLLLTDVRLGAFNGLQLVILAKAQRPETVAIVISAFDDSTLRKEAEQAGALRPEAVHQRGLLSSPPRLVRNQRIQRANVTPPSCRQ